MMKKLYASLYPSNIREFNIAAHTQIGLIIIPEQINEHENRQNDPAYSRGGQFLEDFRSFQWLEIGTRWFALANFTELVSDVRTFFTTQMMPMYGLRTYNNQGNIEPMFFSESQNPTFVMYFYNDDRVENYEKFDAVLASDWRQNARENFNQLFR